ncbi:MAG: Hpt domain-containing protein, partial [Chloroflexales bacterium]
MDLTSFYNQFREETTENIRVLGDGLLTLEGAEDEAVRRAAIDRIFRAMHTIKGSARMLGFEAVGRLAHALESLLGELRQGQRSLDRPLADALLAAGDAILVLTVATVEGRPAPVDVDAIIAGLPPPTAAPATAPAAAAPTPASPPTPAPANDSSAPPSPTPARGTARHTVRVRVDR